jgi:hypothetical protein
VFHEELEGAIGEEKLKARVKETSGIRQYV